MKDIIEVMQRDKVIQSYYLYCPLCNKEVSGATNKQVEHNLRQHMKTHPETPLNQQKELFRIKQWGEKWNAEQREKQKKKE